MLKEQRKQTERMVFEYEKKVFRGHGIDQRTG